MKRWLMAGLALVLISTAMAGAVFAQPGTALKDGGDKKLERSLSAAEDYSAKVKKRDFITKEEAKQIALNHTDGKITEVERDWDDGRLVYEIEMRTNRGEAEFEIDGVTGKIIEFEHDDDDDKKSKKRYVQSTKDNGAKVNKKNYITNEEAMQIALKHTSGKITEVERDWDDGRLVYEIEMRTNRGEAEFEIDGVTGKIIEFEHDDDDDDDDDDWD